MKFGALGFLIFVFATWFTRFPVVTAWEWIGLSVLFYLILALLMDLEIIL